MEEGVEERAVARPDLEGDLKRSLDLSAIEEIDQRERFRRVDFVADSDLDALFA
jgi:hypothetical protein